MDREITGPDIPSEDPLYASDGPPPESVERISITQPQKNTARFCRIPGYVIEDGLWAKLAFSEAVLFAALCHHANRKLGFRTWPSPKTLRRETGLHPNTILLAMKELKDQGLIAFRWVPARSGGKYRCAWIAAEKPFKFSTDHATFRGHDA